MIMGPLNRNEKHFQELTLYYQQLTKLNITMSDWPQTYRNIEGLERMLTTLLAIAINGDR